MSWTSRLIDAQEHIDFLEVGMVHALEERAEVIANAHRAGLSREEIAGVPGLAASDVDAAIAGDSLTQTVKARPRADPR